MSTVPRLRNSDLIYIPRTWPVIDSHFRSDLCPLWCTPFRLMASYHLLNGLSTLGRNSNYFKSCLPKEGVQTLNLILLCSQDSDMGLDLPQADASLWAFDLEVSKVRKQVLLETWHFVGAGGCKNMWHMRVAAIPQWFLSGWQFPPGPGGAAAAIPVMIVSSSGQFCSVVEFHFWNYPGTTSLVLPQIPWAIQNPFKHVPFLLSQS